jgi:SynChlorMet cassette radical SAM/SPASM protein ScmF
MGCETELTTQEQAAASQRNLNLPEGVPPLTSLYMYIAGSCNMACRHCWISPTYEPDNSNGQFLKLEYIKKAVEEAKPLGLQSVKLTGGEPTLHPQFREIVEYLDNEGIAILIESNGTLIDKELAIFLKSKKMVFFISISLDGATTKTHEVLRDVAGSFKRVINGINFLVEAGFNPQLICTLYQGNVHEIEKIVRLAENLGCGSVKFNHIQQVGRGKSFSSQNGLSIKEILDKYDLIQNKIQKKVKVQIFYDIPFAFLSIKNLQKNSLNRCSLQNVLGILSGGEIAFCGIGVTVPELVFGYIQDNDLNGIWKSNPKILSLRKDIPSSFDGICSQCVFRDSCQGCCIANNYHRAGRLNASYFFCELADKMGLFPIARKK